MSFLSDFRVAPDGAEAQGDGDGERERQYVTPVTAGASSRPTSGLAGGWGGVASPAPPVTVAPVQPAASPNPVPAWCDQPQPSYRPAAAGYGAAPGYAPAPGGYAASPPGYGPEPSFGAAASYAPPPAGGWTTNAWGDVVPATAGGPPLNKKPPLVLIASVAVAIVMLMAGATFVVTRSSSGPSLSGLTATQILDKSLTAARAAGSMHVTGTFSDSGSPQQGTLDLLPSAGTETVTIDGQSASMLSVGGQLYFKADTGYWSNQFKAPGQVAQRLGGRWVQIPAGEADFKQISAMLKMPTIIDQLLAMSGVISKIPTPDKGEVTLTGTVPYNDLNKDSGAGDTATLVISNSPPFLPVSISYSDPDNGATSMTFSNWGEKMQLTPPASPVELPAGSDPFPSASAGSGSTTS